MITPTGRAFNFADADERVLPATQMLCMARAFGRPDFAAHELELKLRRPEVFDLIWCDDRPPTISLPKQPRDRPFRGTEVVCFRSAWNDPQATYLGFKAGRNTTSHAHLDVGSFILESQGVRWAVDLGPENYVKDYFSPRRWQFWRARNESHNTLTLDSEIQNPRAEAPIIAFHSTPDRAHAVAEMSAAYRMPAKPLLRGVALLNRRDVLIQDEIQPTNDKEVVWNMYTPAAVTLDGATAELTLRGARLTARILSPPVARFEVVRATARAAPNIQCLRITLSAKPPEQRIAVWLSPFDDVTVPDLEPLSRWVDVAPVQTSRP